jgi:DNA-binding CsgD family transcriptional regulator
MSDANPIAERDVRDMVRLLGGVAADPGDHAAKKCRLMKGLCALVGADYWVWALCVKLVPGEQPVYINAYNGGFGAEQMGAFMKAIDHPDFKNVTRPFAAELARKQTHLTRLQCEIDPKNLFVDKQVFLLWKEAGIGPVLLSYRPLPQDGMLSAIALYRRHGKTSFDSREARIAHIILTEVPWLHTEGWTTLPSAAVPLLARRPRTVFNLLLQGLSRKQIAAGLKISEHTVNDYVKAVYRHFSVSSQSQLIRRFYCGDGGDI